jgi:nucleoside-diphosphate-sugar epimerase
LTTGAGLEPAFHGVHKVFHLAGVVQANSFAEYHEGNAVASRHVARAAARAGVERLVHISSVAAIGPTFGAERAAEDVLPHPQSGYGRSKLEGEDEIRNSPICPISVIIRPSAVYGPRDRGLLPFFRAVSKGRIPMMGIDPVRLNLIFVDDLVSGIFAVARSSAEGGRAFFLTHPRAVTWEELGACAASRFGIQARAFRIPRPIAMSLAWGAQMFSLLTRKPAKLTRDLVRELCSNWTFDTGRAAREAGFEASTSLADGVDQTISWYLENGWLKA